MYLMPIEKEIIAWQQANPVLHGFTIGFIVALALAFAFWAYKYERERENERMKAERAARRARIKANGGL